MIKKKQNNIKNAKKRASTIVFVIFFFILFLAFAAFAVDGTITLTNRAELQYATESAALAGASGLNSTTDIQTAVTNTFNYLNKNYLKHAKITVNVNLARKRVFVHTTMVSQPFFLSVLGISGINLSANAYATSEALSVKSIYADTGNNNIVSWVTQAATYFSDIISKNSISTTNLHDTAILRPLGNSYSASYNSTTASIPLLNLIDSGNPISLGPGGFITLKLPAPIIDKPGYDLYIGETGDALEGYLVYAGIDVNPYSPYVSADNRGAGIAWINISCSGAPVISPSTSALGPYTVATNYPDLQNQKKFYGSAYYDIGDACISPASNVRNYISMIKYLRIVDDNQETAFVSIPGDTSNPRHFYKTILYGESSTATAGADINDIKVLNHVRLITKTEYDS